MSAPEGMNDVALKPKLLRSLLREYVPDEKHPFSNPSELSYVVSTIKTHKLLSEWTTQSGQEDVVEAWKLAVDSWVNRLLTLASSTLVRGDSSYIWITGDMFVLEIAGVVYKSFNGHNLMVFALSRQASNWMFIFVFVVQMGIFTSIFFIQGNR